MATEVTTSFRQGVNGYAGTLDTMLQQKSPSISSGTATVIGADGDVGAEMQVLLGFDNLFGAGPGQIPPGAIITSATLTLRTTSASVQGASLYRMLVDWDSTSTWASLGNGVQTNGTEAVATADLTTGTITTGDRAFDVTQSLQAWTTAGSTSEAQNAANQGWLVKAGGTDGWDFRSSEGSVKPLLTVTYTIPDAPPPPPPPPLPVVSIAAEVPDPQTEGPNAQISFTVTLDQATTQPVTINYATLDGTAMAGSDFVGIANGTITFAPGETSKTITIDLLDDTLVESAESFSLKLTSATNATVSSTHNTATGSIADNDTPPPPPLPVVSIGAGSPNPQTEGSNAQISFTLNLDKASSQAVTVDYSTINGTATAGSDFVGIANGLITFAPGETTKTITVDLLDDTQVESLETFTVKVNSATNATVSSANNTTSGNIADNDTAPTPSGPIVSIQPKDVDIQTEGSGTTISFTLTLSEAVDYNVKARYSTVSGTAQEGKDFVALVDQSITFLPGQTSKTIKVSLLDDAVVENLEAFTIKIDSTTKATISSTNHTATGYIFDNDAPASVVRVFDTTQYKSGDPSGYGSGDPSGLAYMPGKDGQPGTLFIADSEHDESPYNSSVNLLGISLGDNSYNWSSLRSFTKEPTGLAYNPTNGYLYITDDDKKKIFWLDPAKPSEKLGEFDLSAFGVKDAEDPVFDPHTGNLYLLDGVAGKLLKLSTTGALVASITLPSAFTGLTEAEALAYSHTTADGRAAFFVGGGSSTTIFQIDETGKLLSASDALANYINPITGAKPSVKGMEWAPSSDPNDGNTMSLYVADYGVDQQNDGRVFEIQFGSGLLIA
jgi:hypothetical protein